MIRFATINLDFETKADDIHRQLRPAMETVPFDILCCQETIPSGTDSHTKIRDLSRMLGMNYMHSIVTHNRSDAKSGHPQQTGLSILTGKQAWMLNSGSLSLKDIPGEPRQAQFGLIRHNSNSILVVNLWLEKQNKGKQLEHLLEKAIFSGQFSALLLYTNAPGVIDGKDTKKMLDSRQLALWRTGSNDMRKPHIFILTRKDAPLASVHMTANEMLPLGDGQVTHMDIQRLPKEHHRKQRYLPLSFRERWLGSRDGDRAFAF